MPLNLAGAANAWAAARQRGVTPKTFADLLSIEPEMGSHIDDARAAGHEDQTILDNLNGALPSRANPQTAAAAKLALISGLPDNQRSFALFDTRDDYGPLGLSPQDVDRLGEVSRDADIGEYERMDGASNGLLVQIGNPHNRRLRREWEIAKNQKWPTDPITGRNYDVAHIKALADGGTNALANIRPMHPVEHRLQHMMDGDLSRWAKRAGRARAFGGTAARSVAPLSIISGLSGLLSGRVRTDSFDNFGSDMLGMESEEDERRRQEATRKRFLPNSKPGDLFI